MRYWTLLILVLSCTTKQSSTHSSEKKKAVDTLYYQTNTNELEDTIRTIDASYIDWFCQCANWVTINDYEKHKNDGSLSKQSFFVEPSDTSLRLPDSVGYSGDILRFKGQFYKDEGYPKQYVKTEEKPEKAKVFRFTQYKVLRSGYKNFKQ